MARTTLQHPRLASPRMVSFARAKGLAVTRRTPFHEAHRIIGAWCAAHPRPGRLRRRRRARMRAQLDIFETPIGRAARACGAVS